MKNKVYAIGAKKWLDVYGNTYHNATIITDTNKAYNTGLKYGYGNQYQVSAKELADQLGLEYNPATVIDLGAAYVKTKKEAAKGWRS